MWRLGFFFHEMGFGLLSIFLPLYIMSIASTNGLFYIGLMSALALFLAMPASFFWGWSCDKTKHYKRYILISFIASTIILYLLTLTNSAELLVLLYAVMSILHVAHEPPKNVLIAEMYSREDWEKSFARYEGFTEVGWLIGLLLGFFTSIYNVNPTNTLILCSALNLVAFLASLVLVTDPSLIFERGLVSIEKSVDFACRGVFVASKIFDGIPVNEKLKRENLRAFCTGLILFSLATSILFTPMPVFISKIVADTSLPQSLVFAIFVLNSGGGVVGYFLAGSRSGQTTGKSRVARIVLLRSVLAFLLMAILQTSTYSVVLVTSILILMGFAYALFLVHTLSLSMELIPAGRAGLFNVLVGVGGACGSFIGPYIAQTFSFFSIFVTAGIIFLITYVTFKVFV